MTIEYRGAVELTFLARCLIQAKGSMADAHLIATRRRAPQRVLEVLERSAVLQTHMKSPQSAMSLDSAAALAPYHQMVAAFIESLQQLSVFDRLLAGGMRVIPLRTRLSAVTSAIIGSIVGENQLKPVSRFELSTSTLEPKKAVAIIALSDELKKEAVSGTDAFLAAELKSAVANTTDLNFLAGLLDDAAEVSSSGNTAEDVRRDIRALLAAVTVSAKSRLYLVSGAELAKDIALMPDTTGGAAFPGMTPLGGEISGIPYLVTDGLPSDSDGQRLGLIDASAIAGNSDTVTLDASDQATMELDSAPVGGATANQVSLWQRNLIAIRAERWFGFEKIREDGFAIVRNANYTAGT